MKYTVGDKVKVRCDLEVGKMYGAHYFVSDMNKYIGKTMTIKEVIGNTYHLKEDDGEWCWTEGMLEDLTSKSMLEPCMVVKLRNGELVYVANTKNGLCLLDERKNWIKIQDYDDELCYQVGKNECFDIMEIYDLSELAQQSMKISIVDRRLLWKRKEVKKMTVAEIQKELGYKIEIVEG